MLNCFETEYGSSVQRASVDLRDRILRQPLGLQFSEEDLAKEAGDHHLVCLDGDNVVGVILMRPVNAHVIKMRQVAVEAGDQRKGIGTRMVLFAEGFCREKGYSTIEMHARLEAVPFYERLGYRTSGEQFIEVGIPHVRMFRDLDTANGQER